MLICFVSDERYAAFADVLLEFTDDRGGSWVPRSRTSGLIRLDLPPEAGRETPEFRIHSATPYQFELWRYGWRKELVEICSWIPIFMCRHPPFLRRFRRADGSRTAI